MALNPDRWRKTLAESRWRIDESDENRGISECVLRRVLGGKENTSPGGVTELRREDLDELVSALKGFTSAANETELAYIDEPMTGTQYHRRGRWYGGPVGYEWDEERSLVLFQYLICEGSTEPFTITESSCRYRVSMEWFKGVSVVPTLPTSDHANATTYDMGAVSQDPSTGMWSGFIEKRVRLYERIDEHTSSLNNASRVKRTRHYGVRAGDVDSDGNGINLPNLTTPVLGRTMRISREQNPDCSQNIDVDQDVPSDQERTEYEERADVGVVRTKHTQGTAEALPTRAPNTTVMVRNDPTAVGHTSTIREVRTAKDQLRSEYHESAAQSTLRLTHSENETPLGAPAQVDGLIRRRVNRPTEFGNSETLDEEVEAHNQFRSEYLESGSRSTLRTLNTQSASPLPALTYAAGQIRRRENMPTEFGLTRTIDEVSIARNQYRTEVVRRADARVERQISTEAADPLVDPGLVVGRIGMTSNQATESGLTRTIAETRYAIDQSGSESEASAARTTTRATNTQAVASLGAAVHGAGYIRRTVNRPTEFGLTATVSEEVQAHDQSGSESESTAARTTIRATSTQAAAALGVAEYNNGIIRRNVSRPTEFGLMATVAETTQAHNQLGSESEAGAARTTIRTTNTQSGFALSTAVGGAGYIRRNVNRPTEFGLTATVEEEVQAHDQDGRETEATAARTTVRDTSTQDSSALSDATHAAGFIRRNVNRPTEFGLTATVEEEIEAHDQGGSESEASAARTTTRATQTQAGSVLAPAVHGAGFIRRTVNRPTEFGLTATVSEEVQAHNQSGRETEAGAARVTTRTTNTQSGIGLADATPSAGYIRRNVNRPTEFGLTATVSEEIEAKDQDGRETEATAARTTVRDTSTQDSSALSDATHAAGYIRRNVNRPTEFGLTATVEEEIQAHDQGGSESEASAARTTTRATQTQAGSVLAPAVHGTGFIRRTVNRPTEFGLTATVSEEVQAHNQSGRETEAGAARVTTRTTNTQSGVDLADATPSAGFIRRNVNRPTEFGLTATVSEEVEAKDQDGRETEATAARTTVRDTSTQDAAPLGDAAHVAGYIRRNVNRPTEFGLTSTVEEEIQAHDQVGSETEASAARVTIRATRTQSSAPLGMAMGGGGYIRRNINRPTEFGLTATVAETVEAKDQDGRETEATAARTTVRDTSTQDAAPLGDAAHAPGYIRRNVNRPTEFGLTATVAETVQAHDQSGSETVATASHSIQRDTHTQAVSSLMGAVHSTGFNRRNVSRPTEFGRMATVSEEIQAHNQWGSESEASAARTTLRNSATQSSVGLGAAVHGVGFIRRHVNRPTEFGLTATVSESVEAHDQYGRETEAGAARTTIRTTATQAGVALSDATASAGYIRRNVNRPTEFGLTATVSEEIEAHDQGGSETESTAARTTSRATATQAGSALGVATSGGGFIRRNVNRPTEFGRVATLAEVVEAHDQQGDEVEASLGRTISIQRHTQAGAALTAPAAGTGVTVRHITRPTEFGLFETSKVTVTDLEQTWSHSYDTLNGTAKSWSGSNATDGTVSAIATAFTDETINHISASRTPTGLLNYSASKTPAAVTSGDIPEHLWGNHDFPLLFWDGNMWRAAHVYVIFTRGITSAQHHVNTSSGAAGYDIVATLPGHATGIQFYENGALKKATRCESWMLFT